MLWSFLNFLNCSTHFSYTWNYLYHLLHLNDLFIKYILDISIVEKSHGIGCTQWFFIKALSST
jgi:hypothetical protein